MDSIAKSNNDSNCSCSSCIFKSESDRQSIIDLLALGSRIDRLYYGKYIPLREKKLLKRLVRTKAVYDDLRAQILSDSTLSVKTKRKNAPRNRLPTKKSSTFLKLADMRDLSECCSCCSCSSKFDTRDEVPKRYKRKHLFKSMYRTDHQKAERRVYGGKKGVRFRTKHIRSDPCTCTFKLSGLLKKYSKTKLKNINRSSPLQVPFDLEPMAEENIRPKRSLSATMYQNLKHQKERVTDAFLEGVNKIRDSKTKMQENLELFAKKSLDKLKRPTHKIISSKKSTKLDKQKDAKVIAKVEKDSVDRICECSENDLLLQIKKDSLIKFKDDLRKKHMMKDMECQPECDEQTCDPKECFIKLTQKKMPKQKPQLRKRIDAKNKTDKRTKIANKELKTKNQPEKARNTDDFVKVKPLINIKSRQEKITTDEFKKQTNKMVKKPIKKNKPVNIIKNKQSLRERHSKQAVRIGSSFSFNIEFYKNINAPTEKIYKPESRDLSNQSLTIKHSNYKTKKINSSQFTYHNRSSQSTVNIKKPKKYKKKKGLKRCFCTLSFRGNKGNTYRNKMKNKRKRLKHTQTDEFFNIHAGDKIPEVKHRNVYTRKVEGTHEKFEFVPRVCDPGICIPDQCDPFNCMRIMNMRPVKVKRRSVKCLCPASSRSRGTKSTSSLTSRGSATTPNYVQSIITYTKKPKKIKKRVEKVEILKKRVKKPKIYNKQPIVDNRQAVRIGSTFSFNIEFYKNKPLSPQSSTRQSLPIKPKLKTKAHKKQKKLQYKMVRKNQQTSSDSHVTNVKRYHKNNKKRGLNIDLKRCFCTLKLQDNYLKHRRQKYLKNKRKMHSTATETVDNSYLDILMLNRSTKMDQKRKKMLEPFECEPFVCVPGECDPYLCLERIEKRHRYLKDASVITKPLLRAEGSSTGRSEIYSKFIQVQPKIKTKHEKTFTKMRKRAKKKELEEESVKRLKFDDKFSDDWGDKRSVNIGSSFSFNVEFHKRLPTTLPTLQYVPKKKSIKNVNTNHELNVATHDTQIEKSRRHQSSMIRPLMKRCFCTMNLKKKQKQQLLNTVFSKTMRPNVYTVNRILTEKTCHHYKYNRDIDNEIDINRFIKHKLSLTSANLYSYLSNKSICTYEKKYKTRTIRSLSMFQSTFHMLEPVKGNSKEMKICLNKSSSKCRSLRLNTKKSYVTNECHNVIRYDNNKYAEEITILPPISNQMQPNPVSQYYKKCFCSFNLHVENKYNRNLRNIKFRKNFIHPYECEPGICIPGQCDPNECIKLIMKRTAKHKAVKNNTGRIITHSGSSNTYPFANKSTKTRREFLLKKNLSENRKELYDSNNNRAVRIGSSFSFDIEFFKKSNTLDNNSQRTLMTHLDSPYKKARKIKNKPSKSYKTLGTAIKQQNYRNITSQSKLTSGVHRGSVTSPILNKCFCTLKLQKRGKKYKNLTSGQSKPTLYHDANIIKIKTASKSQNTKKYKTLAAPQLQPYECPPNICDPDNCDPYQCLDIMKRKMKYMHDKNLGVDPIFYKNRSVHSITTRNRTRGSQSVRPYRSIPKSQQKLRLGGTDSNSFVPSKQAVRIGSNFSFNIEFYKDRSPYSTGHQHLNDSHYIKHLNNAKQGSSTKPSVRESDSETMKIKPLKHQKSQIQNVVRNSSSMASTFVKRCFCTAKLLRTNKNNAGLHFIKYPKPSFFKKCLCWLKESRASRLKLKNQGINNVIKRCFCTMQFYNKKEKTDHNVKTKTKSMMTEKKTLLPYECEPGICIPYQCDPYKCDKIMQTRRKEKHMFKAGKQNRPVLLPYECEPLTCIPGECNPIECLKRIKKREYHYKNFGTAAANAMYTASTMTMTRANAKSKNKINQSRIRDNLMQPYATAKKDLSSNFNKQAVRIGSKFSFDIQFYKNTSIPDLKSYHNYMRTPVDKPKKVIKKTNFPPVIKKTSFTPVMPQVRTKHIQSAQRNSDLKSFYKKCFCILKLNKFKTKPRPMPKTRKTIDASTDNSTSILKTRHKLLPYECEPGICVPGYCDPLECKKRIEKRHLKEFNQQTGNRLRSKQKGTKTRGKKTVKLQMPKSLQQNEEQQLREFQKKYTNKKVCRIGSEFSFDIEFFKNRYDKPDVQVRKFIDNEKRVKKINRTSNTELMRNYAFQTDRENKNFNTLSVQSPLKRCFCTLRLQNLPDNSFKTIERKPSQRSVISYVTPANFNIASKSRDATSQVVRQSFNKGITMKTLQHKKNMQTKGVVRVHDFSKQANLERKRLAELPTHQKPFNKQALKIGSNFSFQIEFFKQAPSKAELVNVNDSRGNTRQKGDYSKSLSAKNRFSQVKSIDSKGKGLQVNNVLKRCFCTLKLQDTKAKSVKKVIPKYSGTQNFPQVIEVRRVSIQRKPKQIAQQTMPPIKTVATQSRKKSKKKKSVSEQCNCYKSEASEHDNTNEMKTILPYTPKKFNKSNSKTLLTRQHKKNYHKSKERHTINKRLTRKKSERGINIITHPKYDLGKESPVFNMKKFFCQCAHLLNPKKDAARDSDFYKSEETLTAPDVSKLCQNKRCRVKKSKKIKVNPKNNVARCHTECLAEKHYSLQRDGKDNVKYLKSEVISNANHINIKKNKELNVKNYKKNGPICCTCGFFREQTKGNMKMDTLCFFCQNKMQEQINRNNLSSPRLNVRFLDSLITSQTNFLEKKRRIKKHIKLSGSKSQAQKRCRSCGRIIDTEEIRKGAGDYSETKKKPHKRSQSSSDKLKRIFKSKLCHKVDDTKDMPPKPVFEMLLNAGNYDIINKDDIMDNLAGVSKMKNRSKPQPCVCGSLVCAEKNKNISSSPKSQKNIWRPCVCNSPICNRESAAMRRISADPDQITCLCQKMKDKETNKHKKEEARKLKARLKQQRKEDEIRKRKRKKIDKVKEKQINKKSSDVVLLAESVIDIGKLGITACSDILRGIVRITSDPKEAIRKLKAMKDNPKLIVRNVKHNIGDSGVAGTIRRVRLRCLSMKGLKKLKRKLESYALTNYFLHIAAKDPKKRIVKPRREVRVRERLDYGCSLYMGSLRKRPFLFVYDRCPWFYPHFLSLINVYKQFRDILLFLLAVIVWSPCILCMELCRAMTCCIFCTG